MHGQERELEFTGVNGNWWIGLSALHTLFAREHNAICDRLKIDYQDRDGDWLFEKARLILAALIAKIHTVEWTPALLNTPALRFGMRGELVGHPGRGVRARLRPARHSEVMSGIIGSPADHHGVRYTLTEEFVAVYRMHSLMRDDFSFPPTCRQSADPHRHLPEVSASNTHRLYADVPFVDVVYSLGTRESRRPRSAQLSAPPADLRRQDLASRPISRQWRSSATANAACRATASSVAACST